MLSQDSRYKLIGEEAYPSRAQKLATASATAAGFGSACGSGAAAANASRFRHGELLIESA